MDFIDLQLSDVLVSIMHHGGALNHLLIESNLYLVLGENPRYCYSFGVVPVRCRRCYRAKTVTFCNISVIVENI